MTSHNCPTNLQRKLIIWSTSPFYFSQQNESWRLLTLAEVSVELPDSTDRISQRLSTAGGGSTRRSRGSLIEPAAPLWAPGLQWVGQHGETVLHQLEQQNSTLQDLFCLTETKTLCWAWLCQTIIIAVLMTEVSECIHKKHSSDSAITHNSLSLL